VGLNLFNRYYGNPTPDVDRQYFVKNIEVWKSITQTLRNPNERNAIAYINLPPLIPGNRYADSLRDENKQEIQGEIAKGRFILLTEGVDYSIQQETGFITFKTNLQETDVIAVAYQVEGPNFNTNTDDTFFGEFLSQTQQDTSQRLVLKLVKPQNLLPQHKEAWKLLLKNIYPTGGRNINREGFEFDIKYENDASGGEAQNVIGDVKLLNAFGLDKVDASGMTQPDGIFDFKVGQTIYPETGEIIFPHLQPFGRNIPRNLENADSLRFLDVYDTTAQSARNNKVKDKWVLYGKYTGTVSSVYQLGFNIVENSVRVTLNGRELSPGSDYFVDYNIGQLTIRNDAALVPGANLKITYEENDLFQLASKTLFGMRGEIAVSRKTKIGFSALTLSQQTLSDKVRIGEEPLSNSIYGLDFSTSADLPFLTKLLDNVISTREMSSVTLRGEFAYMDPDPNTKKSTIASDNGKSIAYIDDFEGTKRIIPIGVSYTSWKDLSVPTRLSSINNIPDIADSLKMLYKGKSFWFNVLPSDVNVKDIWPDRRVARGDEQVTVLDYVYMPTRAGSYNRNIQRNDLTQNWGGMMKNLSSTANNLVDENIEFIEFWINRDTLISGASIFEDAKIYLDLGKLSEDVIPNGRLDTEDKNNNDLIDDNEDTGLDGLTDDQERSFYASTEGDPNNDNFNLRGTNTSDIMNYFYINGTEGNAALTDIGRFPDTEDLNRNGSLDQLNSFFRYEIPLKIEGNPYIAGGSDARGWYLYRIPLKEFKDEIGNPSFSVVEFIRFFVTNVDTTLRFRIAEFNLVGNQWQKKIQNDDVLAISVVNVEDNPNYSSPPGVQRERDRTRPDQEILRNEQSLNLIINGLKGGENREVIKYLYRPLDVFNYSEMKLFIHGNVEGKVAYADENQNPAKVYFRFGTDSNNYYEYRQPILRGWNEISLLFSELTAIKQLRDSVSQEIAPIPVKDLPGRFYYLKGNPNLTSIKFLSVIIVNNSHPREFNDLFGEVWVNELRVIGADDTPGWAYSVATSLKLADLLQVSFNMSQTNPYFHRLQDRFGSRVEAKNWGISADVDVLKILPFNTQGSNLKINYSRTESIGSPIFLPGTDIKIDEAARRLEERLINPTDSTVKSISPEEARKLAEQMKVEAKTISTSDTWTASNIKLKIPIEHWLIRDSFNSLTYGFNYNKTFSRNPTTQSNVNWVWNANMNYAVNLSPDYFFYPASIPVAGTVLALFSDYRNTKVYYTPQTFSWTVAAKRSRATNVSRQIGNAASRETISRDFTASRGLNIAWKMTEGGFLNVSTTYNFDIASSLTHLEADTNNLQRPEAQIWRDIVSGNIFGRDYQFRQSFDLRTSPKLPSFWDLNKYFQITTGYNVSY
ncbi:MAG TPA: cell surface protein SprA, partial [Ignavibacteriaceae bacterium]|nr:cell surface protein SprA [Ignavibacteriaceae bacterium]